MYLNTANIHPHNTQLLPFACKLQVKMMYPSWNKMRVHTASTFLHTYLQNTHIHTQRTHATNQARAVFLHDCCHLLTHVFLSSGHCRNSKVETANIFRSKIRICSCSSVLAPVNVPFCSNNLTAAAVLQRQK